VRLSPHERRVGRDTTLAEGAQQRQRRRRDRSRDGAGRRDRDRELGPGKSTDPVASPEQDRQAGGGVMWDVEEHFERHAAAGGDGRRLRAVEEESPVGQGGVPAPEPLDVDGARIKGHRLVRRVPERYYSHVSAAHRREAVEVLQRALVESQLESHVEPDLGGQNRARTAKSGRSERESGSGGRVPAGY
jgi:hypothetical protein